MISTALTASGRKGSKMDLIDRAELLKHLDYVCTGAGLWSNIFEDVIADCKKFIEHELAVDAVPISYILSWINNNSGGSIVSMMMHDWYKSKEKDGEKDDKGYTFY